MEEGQKHQNLWKGVTIMIEQKTIESEVTINRRRVEVNEYINPVIASIIMDAKKNPERYIREYKIPAEGE